MASSSGAAREIEQLPLPMEEGGGGPTDLVLAKTKILSSIASVKKKLREMDPSAKVTIPNLLEGVFGDLANKKVLKLLLVGPAGAGKSTLANTLACRYVNRVEEKTFTKSVTKDVDRTEITVRIGESQNYTLIIYDTPGFTGNVEEDARVRAKIEEKIPNPDMVVVCFEITAFGGRRLEFLHDNVIKAMKKVRGGALLNCCAIAITKVNMLARQCEDRLADPRQGTPSESDTRAWHDAVRDAVNQWRVMWKEILSDCALSKQQIDGIPVSIFGRMEFTDDERKTPCNVTPIGPWGRDWLKESWAAVMSMAPHLLPLCFIIANQFHADPNISEEMHRDGPDPLLLVLKSGRAIGIGAAMAGCALLAVGFSLAPSTAGSSLAGAFAGAAVLFGIRRGGELYREYQDEKRRANLKAYGAEYSPAEAVASLEKFEMMLTTNAGVGSGAVSRVDWTTN